MIVDVASEELVIIVFTNSVPLYVFASLLYVVPDTSYSVLAFEGRPLSLRVIICLYRNAPERVKVSVSIFPV